MRIDMHSHIIPEELPRFADKFGYEGFVHLEHHKEGAAKMMKGDEFFREVAENCWSPEKRFEDMERNGIDMQVISTIPVMFSYWAKAEHGLEVARFLNDDLAGTVQEHPDRFIGLGTLPMQAPELAAKELERCIKELGLNGIQIGSNINGTNLNDPSLFPVFETAEKLGAALFVHPWQMLGMKEIPDYWMPWLVGMPAETSRAICSMIFGGVFERFPGLKACFSHGGGSFPGTIGRVEHGFNSRPDLVAVDNQRNPREYCGHFWVDSIVFDSRQLRYIIDLFGSDRVCLGSDYPFPLGELDTGSLIDSMDLDEQTKRNLFQHSASDWLGLEREEPMKAV